MEKEKGGRRRRDRGGVRGSKTASGEDGGERKVEEYVQISSRHLMHIQVERERERFGGKMVEKCSICLTVLLLW